MLGEMYAYLDIPEPAFGVQLIHQNTEYPGIRDGGARWRCGSHAQRISFECVGAGSSYLLPMGDDGPSREVRQFGLVNVQRGFDRDLRG
jgi:hypothetical protein